MRKISLFGWLFVLAGLLGCAGQVDEVATAVSPSPTNAATVTATPTATTVPTNTATASPIPSATPGLLTLPDAYVARVQNPPAGIWPNHVWWLPDAGEEPFLIQWGDDLRWQALPIAPETVFAYDGERGLLYFGQQPWQPALNGDYPVTDLHVYDFQSNSTMMLLPRSVAGMDWCSLRPVIAFAKNGRVDLNMPVATAEMEVVARGVTPIFSCIPGYLPPPADGGPGELIVYGRGADLLLLNWFQGPTELLLEGQLSAPMHFAPVWDLTNELLWLAHEPLVLLPLSRSAYFDEERPFGQEPIAPTYPNGAPLEPATITQLLWSPQHNILLTQTDAPFLQVRAYGLSEQFGYVVDDFSLPRWRDHQLVGWLEAGERAILLDDAGELLVWHVATGMEERP